MANELQVPNLPIGATGYILIPSDQGQFYLNDEGPVPNYEDYDSTHRPDYAIPLTALGATTFAVADRPSNFTALVTAPHFAYMAYVQLGDQPDDGDTLIATGLCGPTPADLMALNGNSTADNSATLRLKQINVTNTSQAGNAVLDSAVVLKASSGPFSAGSGLYCEGRSHGIDTAGGILGCLDAIDFSDPGAMENWNTFSTLLVGVLYKLGIRKSSLNKKTGLLETYDSDGATVLSSEAVTDDGTVQVKNRAS